MSTITLIRTLSAVVISVLAGLLATGIYTEATHAPDQS
jgi:hypothetical protein